jgi:hypothetical protein
MLAGDGCGDGEGERNRQKSHRPVSSPPAPSGVVAKVFPGQLAVAEDA